MTCYNPIAGYTKENGQFAFAPRNWSELQPMKISCGKCIGCRLQYAKEWSVRGYYELNAEYVEESSFLTLTYRNESLNNNKEIKKSEIQTFLKKLRNHIKRDLKSNRKIKYMAVGEYGPKTNRPHYHINMFNYRPTDMYKYDFNTKTKTWYYRSQTLEKIWGKGRVIIGDLTPNTIGYTARYVLKKMNYKDNSKHYVDPVTGVVKNKEFLLVSKGIGKEYFMKMVNQIYETDTCCFIGKKNKVVKTKPPRYFDKILKIINIEKYEWIKHTRFIKALENLKSKEELKILETVTIEKIKMKLMRAFENAKNTELIAKYNL